MNNVDGFFEPEWHYALAAARQRRAENLCGYIRQLVCRLGESGWRTARWGRIALVIASVFCAALVPPQGRHIEIIMVAIALASLLSSIAGFAFSAICGAMLFHLSDDHVQVVQIMITCSIANQAAMSWAARRDIDWQGLGVYLAGGAPGLTIGVWVLMHADHRLYTHMLGFFLLAYGTFMLLRKPMVSAWRHPALDLGSGFLGGSRVGPRGSPGHS
jgi:hypothetical protein